MMNTQLKTGHYPILFITLAIPAGILYFSPSAPLEALHLFMSHSLFLTLPDTLAFLKSESFTPFLLSLLQDLLSSFLQFFYSCPRVTL